MVKQIANLEYFPFFHAEGWEDIENEINEESNVCVVCGTKCEGNIHFDCEKELYGI